MHTDKKWNPSPRIRVTDADGLANNTAHALLILEITRKEIESGCFASVLERLHVMTDSKQNVLRYRESLTFMVDGYNTDPRELFEIPEVRIFFGLLVAEWPHWIWFLTRGAGSIGLLMAILCQVSVVRGKNNELGTEFADKKELQNVFTGLLKRGNALFQAYNIPEALIEASVSGALAELGL